MAREGREVRGTRSGVTVGRVARIAGPLCILAFLVNATIVAVALQGFNVPADTAMLDFPALLFGSVGPVIGNSVGFYASYRKPFAASIVVFLTPGVLLTAAFMVPVVTNFLDDSDVGALMASALVTVSPTILAVAVLIRRRPALLDATATTDAPGAGDPQQPPAEAATQPSPGPAGSPAPASLKHTLRWSPAALESLKDPGAPPPRREEPEDPAGERPDPGSTGRGRRDGR